MDANEPPLIALIKWPFRQLGFESPTWLVFIIFVFVIVASIASILIPLTSGGAIEGDVVNSIVAIGNDIQQAIYNYPPPKFSYEFDASFPESVLKETGKYHTYLGLIFTHSPGTHAPFDSIETGVDLNNCKNTQGNNLIALNEENGMLRTGRFLECITDDPINDDGKLFTYVPN